MFQRLYWQLRRRCVLRRLLASLKVMRFCLLRPRSHAGSLVEVGGEDWVWVDEESLRRQCMYLWQTMQQVDKPSSTNIS